MTIDSHIYSHFNEYFTQKMNSKKYSLNVENERKPKYDYK